MIQDNFSIIDLAGLVERTFADTKLPEEFCNDPRARLAEHGILLPVNALNLVVRQFRPVDIGGLQDCARFESDPETSSNEEHPFDLRLFWYGAKDAVFLLGKPRDLRRLGAVAVNRGFHALLTPYQWMLVTEPKKGYSNLMKYTPLTDTRSGVRRGLLIARSENELALGWLASMLGWDSVLGIVLGYPRCCVRWFCRYWRHAEARHCGDLVPIAIEHSGPGPFNWRTNVLTRYFDRCLLQHFPCTFRCQLSSNLAEHTMCCLRNYEPKLAQSIVELMRAPVIYTARSGVFAFPGGAVEISSQDWRLRYERTRMISTTTDSVMFRHLSNLSTIAGPVENSLRMNGENDAYFLCFE